MQLAYHFPTHVFPDWNIQAKMNFAFKKFGPDYITLRGGWLHMISGIILRQAMILIGYITFTYAVIYYILPRYISNKKKWIATTGLLLLLFIAFLVIDYFITYLTHIESNAGKIKRGVPISMPSAARIMTGMTGSFTFYLATLVGLAVTIKLLKQWWLKQKETEQLSKEKVSAELQLLKAQIHPHFLFNSLNNIYSFALDSSAKAPEMIQKLSGLLHYMLYDCKQPLVTLEKELKMIQDYISLEKIRYGDRLDLEVTVNEISPPREITSNLIAPLLLIPFVENSFKHGTSKMAEHPKVNLTITIKDNILFFKLINRKPITFTETCLNTNRGLGLKNVRKRLALIYPERHELQVLEDPSEYSVWLKIILIKTEPHEKKTLIKKESVVYDELA